MAMKKREAIEAARKALAHSVRSGATKKGSVSPERASEPASGCIGTQLQPPEFDFSGWHFVALNGPFEDELLNDAGDAALRAPDGTHIGLAWSATGKLAQYFDFKSPSAPMLYVDVPAPVASWSGLRSYLEALAPALDADLLARQTRK